MVGKEGRCIHAGAGEVTDPPVPVGIIGVQGIAGYEECAVWCSGFLTGDDVLQRYRASSRLKNACRDNLLPAVHDAVYLPAKLTDFILFGVNFKTKNFLRCLMYNLPYSFCAYDI